MCSVEPDKDVLLTLTQASGADREAPPTNDECAKSHADVMSKRTMTPLPGCIGSRPRTEANTWTVQLSICFSEKLYNKVKIVWKVVWNSAQIFVTLYPMEQNVFIPVFILHHHLPPGGARQCGF